MAGEIVVVIKKGKDYWNRTLVDLEETSELTMGQVFQAVARHYSKTPSDYSRWISFETNRGEFDAMKNIFDNLENDLEKIRAACEWLGEDSL